ncbi:Pkinase-domain-containing protein, partial [Rozella allomycis CSF55]
ADNQQLYDQRADQKPIIESGSDNSKVCSSDYIKSLYTVQKTLGSGTYGQVMLGIRNADHKMATIKTIPKKKLCKEFWNNEEERPNEIVCLAKLNNEHIIKYIESFESPDAFYIITEYFPDATDLFQYVDEHPHMEEYVASSIFKQIVEAVKHCHDNQIVHRDLKEENILIDAKGNIKLIDFGSATFCPPAHKFNIFFGTMEYASPEILTGKPYLGYENDIWALGIILYALLYSEYPFPDVDETIQGNIKPPFACTSESFALIKMLLHPVPEKRPNCSVILQHEWVSANYV